MSEITDKLGLLLARIEALGELATMEARRLARQLELVDEQLGHIERSRTDA